MLDTAKKQKKAIAGLEKDLRGLVKDEEKAETLLLKRKLIEKQAEVDTIKREGTYFKIREQEAEIES